MPRSPPEFVPADPNFATTRLIVDNFAYEGETIEVETRNTRRLDAGEKSTSPPWGKAACLKRWLMSTIWAGFVRFERTGDIPTKVRNSSGDAQRVLDGEPPASV